MMMKINNFENSDYNKIPDGLIIYPDKNGIESIKNEDLKKHKIKEYYGFYKLGVKLPVIQ